MRERHAAVSSGVDLLIVGAGIQGATAAYEASRRGRSVLLVDRDDFGAGSSSNSMKVAHGGLRYLQSLDLPRSLESIRERRRLLRLAPGLIRPLRCEMDVTGRSAGYRALLRGGLLLNEAVSWHRNRGVPGSHRLPAARFPGWWDALIEDTERVIFAFLHSAAAANPGGFALRNHAALERLEHRDGRVVGARIAGLGSIEAGAVLSCIGATRPGQPAGLSMNLVVEGLGLAKDGVARALPHPDEGRNVFVVPWRGRSIVGTWDRSYPYDPSAPLRFECAWVDECLAWLAPVHRELARLTRREVRFVHAGLLPWDSADAGHPSDRFRVERRPDGLVDVRGVKWTTAYGVSVRALDVAEASLPRRPAPTPAVEALVDPRTLLARFLDEGPGRREPVLPGRTDLACGAVLFAVEREWARDLADVLLRRTASAAAGHPGVPLVEAVSRLLQRHLDWSEIERRAQVEAFHESFHFAGNVPRG